MGIWSAVARKNWSQLKLPKGHTVYKVFPQIVRGCSIPLNPPFEDAAGEFNIWKCQQFWETFEAPQPPTFGEHELKVPQD